LFKGYFLSKEKLNAILPNQETALIFGCGSGITACIDYLAYEIIGSKMKDQYTTDLGQNGDKVKVYLLKINCASISI
jgi:thiosulfate/3-mercaptopyruvate sulfurtransferase